MLAVRWAEFVDYVCDAVPGVNPWVTILGMGLVLVLTVWTIIEMLDSLRQGFVKRVGWIPALALSTLLAGVAPSSNPTLDDKEQNRAYVAQVAEERRAIGDMLTGGSDASWTPSGSAGSREGESAGPLRGDAPELVFTSTNTTMTLTGEDIARGYRLESVTTNYVDDGPDGDDGPMH